MRPKDSDEARALVIETWQREAGTAAATATAAAVAAANNEVKGRRERVE